MSDTAGGTGCSPSGAAPHDGLKELTITHAGRTVTVHRGLSHPDQYLYLDVGGQRFFLGVLEKGMTRGDVKRLAIAWLDAHRARPEAPPRADVDVTVGR